MSADHCRGAGVWRPRGSCFLTSPGEVKAREARRLSKITSLIGSNAADCEEVTSATGEGIETGRKEMAIPRSQERSVTSGGAVLTRAQPGTSSQPT